MRHGIWNSSAHSRHETPCRGSSGISYRSNNVNEALGSTMESVVFEDSPLANYLEGAWSIVRLFQNAASGPLAEMVDRTRRSGQ